MKFKYFMRGLGVGIVFCTLILLAAYQTSPNKLLTDEEVKTRARALGMVEADSDLDKVLQGETNTTEKLEESSDMNTTEKASSAEEVNTTKETSSTEEVNTTKETSSTEEVNTTEEVNSTEENNTTQATTVSSEEQIITAEIVVKKGMQSSTVAKALEKKGIIDSASDFDNYLNKKGYSTKLCVGTYSVKSTDSYEDLAKILMNKK